MSEVVTPLGIGLPLVDPILGCVGRVLGCRIDRICLYMGVGKWMQIDVMDEAFTERAREGELAAALRPVIEAQAGFVISKATPCLGEVGIVSVYLSLQEDGTLLLQVGM